eukprot:TRINITY_DN2943_c0_g1_i2.p1 TRINITY_DN2943_c0_g1~~TRINITY_DN2943_c0_g1_i2.p1  ORF type:complete len:455 (+),score=95.14 TRINITY_DN2943_c0_g1_i2:171-1535(+)
MARKRNRGKGKGNGKGNVNAASGGGSGSGGGGGRGGGGGGRVEPVPSSPLALKREFVNYEGDGARQPREKTHSPVRFSVVTYNILAQLYCRRYMSPHCSQKWRNWTYRSELQMKELIYLNADVFCLQEVDEFGFFSKRLERLGYTGLFQKRSRCKKDGCAVFWKRDRFALVEKHSIDYNTLADQHCDEEYRTDNVGMVLVLERVRTVGVVKEEEGDGGVDNNVATLAAAAAVAAAGRGEGDDSSDDVDRDPDSSNLDDVDALVCGMASTNLFASLEDNVDGPPPLTIESDVLSATERTGEMILIANTHLFWNPTRNYVKVDQARLFRATISRVAERVRCPTIVCGDFNSLPLSHVYFTMTRRGVTAAPGEKNDDGGGSCSCGGSGCISCGVGSSDGDGGSEEEENVPYLRSTYGCYLQHRPVQWDAPREETSAVPATSSTLVPPSSTSSTSSSS